MIVRIWHGRTKSKDAIAYREFVIETGIKDYTSTNGNSGAQIWQRQEGDITISGRFPGGKTWKALKPLPVMKLKKQNTMMTTKNIYWNLNPM
jgi:hypothetical protein